MNKCTIAAASLTVLLPVAIAGCSTQPAAETAAAAQSAVQPAGTPGLMAPAHQVTASGPAAESVSGPVLETMDAATYTYIKVKTASGEIWAASNKFDVKVGDRVTVPLESPMENFHSQSLNRDFPLIYFASRVVREGDADAPAVAQMPAGHPPAAPVASVTEKIAPPAGGRSIASVWADRKSLTGQNVTVRGKVVKYNGGIMDRNWIHIQDGSGAAADGNHDLTITTADTAKIGDTITVTGTVAIDKDFGAGYSYVVMLEGGKVGPK